MLNINILEKALASRYWSKADLVKAANLSKVTVDRIFKDDADVRLSTLKAVLDALGLTFGAVLDKEESIVSVAPSAVVSGSNNTNPSATLSINTSDAERVKLLEMLLSEKDARIEELKERIEELKAK